MRSVLLAVTAASVLALALFAGPATASSRVQFGIQDDAWLEFGPGNRSPSASPSSIASGSTSFASRSTGIAWSRRQESSAGAAPTVCCARSTRAGSIPS